MLGRLKTSSRQMLIGTIAFMASAALIAVCACAFVFPAWAEDVPGVQGDASREGSVVEGDAAEQNEADTAGTASESGASQRPSQNASTSQAGSGQEGSAQDDGSEGEGASSQPLDVEGNEINEGQVSDSSFLYDAAIADLAGADAYYDGQTVQVTGEAVGEPIRALGSLGKGEDEVRVTLYEASSGSSVTVCMAAADADKIKLYGAYGKTGASVRVQGTFHLTCKDHEGESDIHADVVTVVKQGVSHPDEFVPEDFIPGAAVVGVGLILMLVFWRIKERSR